MADRNGDITRTCLSDVGTFVSHQVPLIPCCPMSGNPKVGSALRISYAPRGTVLPVEQLEAMAREYVGGLGAIRGMEELVQDIAIRVAAITGVNVRAVADLVIQPPYGGNLQTMRVTARAKAVAA